MRGDTLFLLSFLIPLPQAMPLTSNNAKRQSGNQAGYVKAKWGAAGFLGEFTLGGKDIDIFLDTGSCTTWVVGSEASACSSQTHCYKPGSSAQRLQSSTVSSWRQSYNDGTAASGDEMVLDTLGSRASGSRFKIGQQNIAVARRANGKNGGKLSELKNGIMGLCREGNAKSEPKRIDTLPTSNGNFDFFTSYLKNDDPRNWHFCFGCMAASSQYDASSGVTVKTTSSGHWYADPAGWAIKITKNGKTERMNLPDRGDILLDTGVTYTSFDTGTLRKIAEAYGGSCSGARCKYPCHVREEDGTPDGTPQAKDVRITLPWGPDGEIPFDPRAFWAEGFNNCPGEGCTCNFGLKTKDSGFGYGSAVYKSAYFKWDTSRSEITMYQYK